VSEQRANPMLDLIWDALGSSNAAEPARRRLLQIAMQPTKSDVELVDEAIALDVIAPAQRDATLRLLVSSPEETRRLLDSMGMGLAREWSEEQGWETPTRQNSSADEAERREIAERFGMRPEEVL
jgi:hypothetical protein